MDGADLCSLFRGGGKVVDRSLYFTAHENNLKDRLKGRNPVVRHALIQGNLKLYRGQEGDIRLVRVFTDSLKEQPLRTDDHAASVEKMNAAMDRWIRSVTQDAEACRMRCDRARKESHAPSK